MPVAGSVALADLGGDDTGEGEDRTGRQVESAGDDDERGGAGDDADWRRLVEDVEQVARRQEGGGGDAERDEEHDKRQQDGVVPEGVDPDPPWRQSLADGRLGHRLRRHYAAPFPCSTSAGSEPNAARRIDSSSSSASRNSATIRPRRITRTRCARPRISSRSPAETVTPYDDTGWTFPEGFGVQASRIVDPAVLDVPMERVSGTIRAPGGTVGTGAGALFAINNNADNQLATLRYQLKDADIQAVEEPFDAEGRHFNRGTFLVRAMPGPMLDTIAKELGLKAYALASAPASKTHPVRAARVAIIHTWTSTQTEGWWRIALDQLRIPYHYISPQDIANIPDLRARWDVLIFPPGGGNALALIEGLPMWGRDPVPWKVSPRHTEPRHARTDRRHPPGIDLARAHHTTELREGGRRVRCRDELHRPGRLVRAHARGRHEPDPR